MRIRVTPLDPVRWPTRAAALCAVVAAGIALPAVASDPPTARSSAMSATSTNAAQRVAIDAGTGRVRALTAAEAKALDDLDRARAESAARKSPLATPAEPLVRTTPDGAKYVVLDDSDAVFAVATRGADGKIRRDCVTGEENADHAVHEHAASRPAGETIYETE